MGHNLGPLGERVIQPQQLALNTYFIAFWSVAMVVLEQHDLLNLMLYFGQIIFASSSLFPLFFSRFPSQIGSV